MVIACVTTSVVVSIATTKILAAYYFKIVDSYVDDELRATLEDGELKITKDEREKAVEEWNRRTTNKKSEEE